ncbi:hypothetical protein ABZ652_24200 [Micromonospora chalcea]|uniref:hypothetical protein n=1 Tax=Micromonospora TaxID=1873 RepID=UPI0004C2E910|nr:hypothetical protein [Micromonospora purpureochromogenes]
MQAAAALVAVPALAIALITYRDQQEINRSQLEMAQLERKRYEERYASRVAFWWERRPTESAGRVRVQNRSPVPMSNLALLVDPIGGILGPREYRFTVDMPPCSILAIALPQLTDDRAFWDEPRGHEVMLEFDDPGTSSWVLRPRGLRHDEYRSFLRESPSVAWAQEIPGTRETAGDCGEGS